MFDLHLQTIIGMVIIAIGTLLGTFFIQRGNALKSSEGSKATQTKLEEQVKEIKLLNEQNIYTQQQNKFTQEQNSVLQNLNNQQNIILNKQSELLEDQSNKIDKQVEKERLKSFSQLLSASNEYYELQIALNSIEGPVFGYDHNFPYKSEIELNHFENELISKINEIIKCKFVLSDPNLLNNWTSYRSSLHINLIPLHYAIGTTMQEHNANGIISSVVDKAFKDNAYENLRAMALELKKARIDIETKIINRGKLDFF